MTDREEAGPTRPSDRRVSRGYRLVPAATFVVGLVLGSVLVAVGFDGGDDAGDAAPSAPSTSPPSASGSPSPTGDLAVTIPAACRQAAEDLHEATRLVRGSVGSFRDFDPDRIVQLLDRLETLDSRIRHLVARCSDVAVQSDGGQPTVDRSPE